MYNNKPGENASTGHKIRICTFAKSNKRSSLLQISLSSNLATSQMNMLMWPFSVVIEDWKALLPARISMLLDNFMDQAEGEVHKIPIKGDTNIFPIRTKRDSSIRFILYRLFHSVAFKSA